MPARPPIPAPMPPAIASADRADRPLLGVALMVGFCVTAPMSDALAKIAAGSFPILQIVAIRFFVQAGVLVPVALSVGRGLRMSGRAWRLTAARSALQVLGIYWMTSALRHLPLADAIAIAFVMPFILMLLGHWWMGETVGPRRIRACLLGFVGTLMVMQPSFAAVGWPVLYPLGVAVVFAVFMLVTRQLGREADAIAMQANSGLLAGGALAVLYLVAPAGSGATWQPIGADGMLLLTMGLLGTLGHLLMTWSLRHAPASTLAPMQYLEIPVAAAIGLALFGDWPDGLAAAGIAVTVGVGLWVLRLEAKAAAT